MISIIICSRNPQCSADFRHHIQSSIGDIPFEIVWIDNSRNQRNMCQAYNYGVRQAKYDYLCFMHEDIVFHSKNWGKIAASAMSDTSVGMLGVQGCVYFCESTVYWTYSGFRKAHIIEIIDGKKEKIFEQDYPCSDEVVAIDGLWMFTRKSLFKNTIKWDERSYAHFHMYDMDISMQLIHKGYKIKIIEDIWIEHKSNGNFNKEFYEDTRIFHEKWDNLLPVGTIEISDEVVSLSHKAALYQICQLGKKNALSLKRLQMWPYMIATKISLLLKKNIWK